jgi:GR25 family glycosyltransferase involved in LPS biosynthesis
MRLFDRFDKVFCVNLDRRPDRMLHFEEQVKKYNLGEFERVSAVDGKNLDISNFKISAGELGLVLTNLKIIEKSISNRYESILILEDDCIFTDEIKEVDSYFSVLPKDWDMLYMGGNHNTHMGILDPYYVNEKVCKLHSTYSTHFVGIKKLMFTKIYNMLRTKSKPLDMFYVELQKDNQVYSFYPALAKQIVDFSDIQNNVTDYNWLIK